MLIEFDPAKDKANQTKHGISLAAAELLDWESAMIELDTRHDYSEARYQAFVPIGERVYMVVFTMRGDAVRIISLRKANVREVKRYANQI